MTRYSKIFLYLTTIAVLAWLLPWAYNFTTPDTRSVPFTMLSEVNNRFLMNHFSDNKFAMIDEDGNIYGENEVDSLLPTFYYRQLISDGRMPDSLNGQPFTPKDIQTGNFMFRCSPSDINMRPTGLYSLLESMSGRVDLVMPTDVFRITDQGIEFIDIESNRMDREKSKTFTDALLKKGFVFPAREISGNPTTRKEYDLGYILIDNDHKVFRLMMVKGRPFVRNTGIDPALEMRHAFVTEYRSRRYFAFLTDKDHRFYVLDKDYNLIPLPVGHFDPEKESMMIIGNMFNWTVRTSGENRVDWYGIDSQDHSLIRSRDTVFQASTAEKIAEYLFPFTLSYTSYSDKFAYPRLENLSYKALILNVILAAGLVLIKRRKKRPYLAGAVVTVFTGLYGFIAFLLLKTPSSGR